MNRIGAHLWQSVSICVRIPAWETTGFHRGTQMPQMRKRNTMHWVNLLSPPLLNSGSKRNAFDFDFWVLKVDNKAKGKSRDSQIVDHLRDLSVTNRLNGFHINDYRRIYDYVWDAVSHYVSVIKNWKCTLLMCEEPLLVQVKAQGVLIGLLTQSGSNLVMDSHGAANNAVGEVIRDPGSWSFALMNTDFHRSTQRFIEPLIKRFAAGILLFSRFFD